MFHLSASLLGRGRRPSHHSTHVSGLKSLSLHSMTQDKQSRGPPFMYGGGETRMSAVGSLSSSERWFRTCLVLGRHSTPTDAPISIAGRIGLLTQLTRWTRQDSNLHLPASPKNRRPCSLHHRPQAKQAYSANVKGTLKANLYPIQDQQPRPGHSA